MRNPKRIPIVLDLMLNKETLLHFLNTSSQKTIDIIYNHWERFEKEWIKYPDCRFGQLLSNLDLVPKDIENHIWNIEEDQWLAENGYINYEDIKFWGVNFYKNGNRRKKTKYVLLRDLETDHIENIIKFFERYSTIDRIPKNYLNYFNKRINE